LRRRACRILESRLACSPRIGRGAYGLLDVAAYFGLSAEACKVRQQRGDASVTAARKDGAAFVGLATPMPPMFLGAGCDEAGMVSY
jgi:hypothetical protein